MKLRYHWFFKLLALCLAVASGAAVILGCAGLALDDLGFYERMRHSQLNQRAYTFCDRAADAVFDHFAWKDTGIEPKLFERFFRWGADVDAVEELEYDFFYTIRDKRTDQILDGSNVSADWLWSHESAFDVRRGHVTELPKAEYYPTYAELSASPDSYPGLDGQPLPALAEGVTAVEYYVISDDSRVNPQNISMECYRHAEAGGADYTIYRMEYTGYDSYRVEVFMTAEQAASLLDTSMEEEFIPRLLWHYPGRKGPLAAWGLALLLLALLWLALTAGRSPSREGIHPDGLNRIPLDLYLLASAIGAIGLAAGSIMVLEQMSFSSIWGYYNGVNVENFYWDLALLGLCGMGAGAIAALFVMACAAQMKVGNNYWLKHTCIGLCWRCGWKNLLRLMKWCLSAGKRIIRGVLGVFRAVGSFFRQLTNLLPLTWQWLIASLCAWGLMLFCCFTGIYYWRPWLIILGILITALPVLYGAFCFGRLRSAAKKMSEGSLEEKIDNPLLMGCFGEFAGHLNALGDVCVESARQQMKSERMKSELITNVSHDIKTPLTSIINYVDLLQKTEDEQSRREYLEVLDRQSQRLKKLIEDLMEMSRANSGNLAVEITPTDVTEAVNQALGEFADTLDGCGLSVLRKAPAEPVLALCDGKHLWRVLSNVLGNVVKYAMPGTRVYVDVTTRGSRTEISVKNISRQMLNISAEELMERFVRGDSSRNTEGNGLGLNIAKSLMELQGGRLEVVVDGDLFKVVLTLTSA